MSSNRCIDVSMYRCISVLKHCVPFDVHNDCNVVVRTMSGVRRELVGSLFICTM